MSILPRTIPRDVMRSASSFLCLFDEQTAGSCPSTGNACGEANTTTTSASKKLEKFRLAMQTLHNKDGKARYAFKRVREDLKGEDWRDGALDLAAEAMFLASIAHPNIVRLRGAIGVPGGPDFTIIMDRLYCTLDEKIEEWKKEGKRQVLGLKLNRAGGCREQIPDRVMVAYDISRALSFLHQHKYACASAVLNVLTEVSEVLICIVSPWLSHSPQHRIQRPQAAQPWFRCTRDYSTFRLWYCERAQVQG